MLFFSRPLWLPLLVLPTLAWAETSNHTDPADPSVAPPPVRYESVFSGYRPFQEQKIAAWPQVLEEVAALPGMAGHAGHGGMSMTGPASSANTATTAPPSLAGSTTSTGAGAAIVGHGRVQEVDKANGRVKLAHEAIETLGWPKMTMFFRLKDIALAEQVKVGEETDFFLEKASVGYVITRFGKARTGPHEGRGQ